MSWKLRRANTKQWLFHRIGKGGSISFSRGQFYMLHHSFLWTGDKFKSVKTSEMWTRIQKRNKWRRHKFTRGQKTYSWFFLFRDSVMRSKSLKDHTHLFSWKSLSSCIRVRNRYFKQRKCTYENLTTTRLISTTKVSFLKEGYSTLWICHNITHKLIKYVVSVKLCMSINAAFLTFLFLIFSHPYRFRFVGGNSLRFRNIIIVSWPKKGEEKRSFPHRHSQNKNRNFVGSTTNYYIYRSQSSALIKEGGGKAKEIGQLLLL